MVCPGHLPSRRHWVVLALTLYVMTLDAWNAMFTDEKSIKQQKSEKVYRDLCQEATSTVSAITVVVTTVSSLDQPITKAQGGRNH